MNIEAIKEPLLPPVWVHEFMAAAIRGDISFGLVTGIDIIRPRCTLCSFGYWIASESECGESRTVRSRKTK